MRENLSNQSINPWIQIKKRNVTKHFFMYFISFKLLSYKVVFFY